MAGAQRATDDLPVLADADIVVCGGGPAGSAAAIAAARLGARTILVEKTGALGGAPVTQLVGVLLSTNGVDLQGLWHEWAARLKAHGGFTPVWRSVSYMTTPHTWLRASYDPEQVKRAWDELAAAAAVRQLLLAHICGARVRAGRVDGVLVHTRAGRAVIAAGCVVDATGDAIVAHDAGVPWHRGVVGKPWPQEVTLNCRRAGVPPPTPGAPCTLGDRPIRRGNAEEKRVDPLDPWAVSDAVCRLRRRLWSEADKLPAPQYLLDTAPELGVRTSRLVQGLCQVSDDDAWECRKSPDGIARASWELDIHAPDDEPPPERWLHHLRRQHQPCSPDQARHEPQQFRQSRRSAQL